MADVSARVQVWSGGLEAVPDNPVHPTAAHVANSAHRVDLSRHRASALAPERVAASDLIFVMDVGQLVAFRKRFPPDRDKVFLLTCLAPELPLEIDDPIDGDEAVFHACFDHISRAVRPIARTLTPRVLDDWRAP